jgi:hypothetical protein
MVARNPARPKAAYIPDTEFLESVDAWRNGNGRFPIDLWRSKGFPGKVVVVKVRKLESRGFLGSTNGRGYFVTAAGRDFLAAQP